MRLSLDIKRFSNEIDGIFSTIKTMLVDLVAEEYNFFNMEADIQRVIKKTGCYVLTSVMNQYDAQSDGIEYR